MLQSESVNDKFHSYTQIENPRGACSWVFLYTYFGWQTKPSGTLPLVISVEPFAYVIRNYTCQNRNSKRYKKFHSFHLLPVAGVGDGNRNYDFKKFWNY